MLIDTHAHLNFNAYIFAKQKFKVLRAKRAGSYKDDVHEVIRRSLRNNVWVINIGTNYETSKKAVEIAEKYSEGVFSAIGLHPINLDTELVKTRIDELEGNNFEKEFDYQKYKKLAQSKKVVAIGEIGLDYYSFRRNQGFCRRQGSYKPKTKTKMEFFKEKQKKVFIQQMNLAEELGLPIIFHCRSAHNDLLEVLNSKFQIPNSKIEGVIHCFTGTWSQAEKYLEMGLYLGFNGIIFKLEMDEIIKKMPLERILLETDCPYLTPPPMTGRNEPLYLKQIVEKIAKIKNISFEKVAERTTQNTKNLFKF